MGIDKHHRKKMESEVRRQLNARKGYFRIWQAHLTARVAECTISTINFDIFITCAWYLAEPPTPRRELSAGKRDNTANSLAMGVLEVVVNCLPQAAVVFILYTFVLVIYRLFFHPLAAIPGPRLASATYLYEWYYDLWLGGQYHFKLKELHKAYGTSLPTLIMKIN